jgi:hypothetical protein
MTRLLTILVVLVALGARATTFYVDYSGGSDSNAGTSTGAAWKLCPGMSGFAGSYSHAAGDRFIFKGGVTWYGGLNIYNSGSSLSVQDYYGVDTNWYSGGSWTQPAIDGQSGQMTFISLHDVSYVYVDNLEIKNGYFAGDDGVFIWYGQSTQVTLTNLYIHAWTHGAGWDDGSHPSGGGFDIVRSTMSGWPTWCASQYLLGCTIDGAPNGTDCGMAWHCSGVARNCIIRNMPNGFLTGGPSPEVSGCDIGPLTHSFSGRHENAIQDMTTPNHTMLIYNNVVHDCATGDQAISLSGGNGLAYVFNNIVYNCRFGHGPVQFDMRLGPYSGYVFNNILETSDPSAPTVGIPGGTGGFCIVKNNVCIKEGGLVDGGFSSTTETPNLVYTHAEAQTAGLITYTRDQPDSINYYQVTPVNSFTPGSSSPVRGVGENLMASAYGLMAALAYDATGGSRPQSAAWDDGVYQYGSVPPPSGGSANTNPVIVVSPSAAYFGIVTSGQSSNYSFTVANTGGGTLTGFVVPAGAWTCASTNFSVESNSTATVTLTYSPTVMAESASIVFTNTATAVAQSVAVSGDLAYVQPAITWAATNGIIRSPFSANGSNLVYGATTTDPSLAGQAIYFITVPSTGDYTLQGLVNAPQAGIKSCFVAFDAPPTTPDNIWDVVPPYTSGFEWRIASWRGATGTFDNDQYTPKVFTLSAGVHTVYVYGRENGWQVQAFTLQSQSSPPPAAPQMVRSKLGMMLGL